MGRGEFSEDVKLEDNISQQASLSHVLASIGGADMLFMFRISDLRQYAFNVKIIVGWRGTTLA